MHADVFGRGGGTERAADHRLVSTCHHCFTRRLILLARPSRLRRRWVADHDIDSGAQLTVKSANGFLISSTQPTWWYSTAAEHSANYQFNFSNAQHATVAVAQTETPYWQIPPTAWALTIEGGSHNQIYGTGMYQWATFTNLNQTSVINLAGTDGTSNFFGVNVHGTDLVLSGEYNISALLPPFVNWFCAGFTGFVSV